MAAKIIHARQSGVPASTNLTETALIIGCSPVYKIFTRIMSHAYLKKWRWIIISNPMNNKTEPGEYSHMAWHAAKLHPAEAIEYLELHRLPESIFIISTS